MSRKSMKTRMNIIPNESIIDFRNALIKLGLHSTTEF